MEAKKRTELVKQVAQLVKSLSQSEKKSLFTKILTEKETLPVSIFRGKLSGLEAITVYLKDQQKKSVKEISFLLKRKNSTLYNTYTKAKQKLKNQKLDLSDHSVLIPVKIFSNRQISILESLVAYLRDQDLSCKKIAQLLNKSYSTVRTVYTRYQKKCR
ncbi:MAG: helix-turn-helix domain-containing protein [Nanoarchaeota archaeon]|nr:helix-turn-helix domain-containing protein [Nanoarchaeota archaeon]MBU1622164.1 helix-turn-helix domain-containing protein [Nanoarchaeota archaeon]